MVTTAAINSECESIPGTCDMRHAVPEAATLRARRQASGARWWASSSLPAGSRSQTSASENNNHHQLHRILITFAAPGELAPWPCSIIRRLSHRAL